MNPLYHMSAARTEEQKRQMEELERDGICVFCTEWFDAHHRNPIIMENDSWYVTENDYPYEGTLLHLLIVSKVHVSAIDQLSPEAGAGFFELIECLKAKYQPLSEAVVIRSGDMSRNGGSVEHLHAHFVVGDTEDPEHQVIRFKVSSRP